MKNSIPQVVGKSLQDLLFLSITVDTFICIRIDVCSLLNQIFNNFIMTTERNNLFNDSDAFNEIIECNVTTST